MRQIIFVITILFNSIFLFAQEQDFEFQPFTSIYYQIDPDSTIENLLSLPANIQGILSDFKSQRFGVYSDNLIFHSGYLYDLDSIEKNRQEVLSNNRKSLLVILKYDLKYEFKNEQLSISQYWVNIKLDKYGQVLFCNFPDMTQNDLKIISFKRVKSIGDSLLLDTEQDLKNAPIKVDLIYDKEREILSWQLCYLRSSGQDHKDYLCFIINAHDSSLIRKEGLMETWITNCCPDPEAEPVYLELNDK